MNWGSEIRHETTKSQSKVIFDQLVWKLCLKLIPKAECDGLITKLEVKMLLYHDEEDTPLSNCLFHLEEQSDIE